MRARYYNPDIKRFVNQDILLGSLGDSTSLNRYAYVNGNPVNLIDPFGLEAQSGWMDGAYNSFIRNRETLLELPYAAMSVHTYDLTINIGTGQWNLIGGNLKSVIVEAASTPRKGYSFGLRSVSKLKIIDFNDSTKKFNTRGGKTPASRAEAKGYPGVKTTSNYGPDFEGTPYLYPVTSGQKNIVKIQMTGRRSSDFTIANKLAGLKGTPSGYTWHHLDDFNPSNNETTMQLVKTKVHQSAQPHKGSSGQYADYYGWKKYK